MNHLSLKLSRHLSSLVPGFEGHYFHVKRRNANTGDIAWFFYCRAEIEEGRVYLAGESRFVFMRDYVIERSPAWQVEDVLRNWNKIMPVAQDGNSVVDSQMNMMRHQFANKIVSAFLYNPNTAYQKIEEYLWSILK